MTKYHAVMIDETGCEFGHSFTSRSRTTAYDYLRERFPESRVDQLESAAETRRREKREYNRANDAYWNDSDPYNYDD